MNILNLFTEFYAYQRNYKGVPFFFLSPLRRFTRYLASFLLPYYLKNTSRTDPQIIVDVVVTFTSFPARIDKVWQVVECMLRQTYRPRKIILWLSLEQFPDRQSIPCSLCELEGDIFEIRLVSGDIRSHKKYYYASLDFFESLLFIIDDDIYYPTNILERTIKEYRRFPKSVISNYAFNIIRDENGICKPYRTWKECHKYSRGMDVFFGSGGGTLVNPSLLYKDLTRIDLALKLTPIADDVWLNAMCRLANVEIVVIQKGLFLPIIRRKNVILSSVNLSYYDSEMCKNDEQLRKVEEYYIEHCLKNIFNVIK